MKIQADITTYLVDKGNKFFINGEEKPLSTILEMMSIDTLRLAVFSNNSQLANVEDSLRLIKALNKKLYLDIHCSDTWADPSHQEIPTSWDFKTIEDLRICFINYIKEIFNLVLKYELEVRFIQIGNEISNGLLWPYLSDSYEYVNFLKMGHAICRYYFPNAEIILHTDLSYSAPKAYKWYETIERHQLDYDYIGLSYYPVWHGSLYELQSTIEKLYALTHKKIVICEMGYMNTEQKTSAWFGHWKCDNIEYSPEGQMKYLKCFKYFLDTLSSKIYPEMYYWGAFSYKSKEHYPISLFGGSGEALPAFYEINEINHIDTKIDTNDKSIIMGR